MKIPKCVSFYLKTIKKYDKFDSVRLFFEEKESNIVVFNEYIPTMEFFNTDSGNHRKHNKEILKFKNKNIDIELIYSIEHTSGNNFYFFHNLNNNCLIIKLDWFYSLRNFYDYFSLWFNCKEGTTFYKILREGEK